MNYKEESGNSFVATLQLYSSVKEEI